MGRFDREIGKELAERLRAADFDVKLAEARLKQDVQGREQLLCQALRRYRSVC